MYVLCAATSMTRPKKRRAFPSLSETWQCPICKAAKSLFTPQGGENLAVSGEPAQALSEKLSQNESQSSYFSDEGTSFGRAIAFRCFVARYLFSTAL